MTLTFGLRYATVDAKMPVFSKKANAANGQKLRPFLLPVWNIV
jgi:hypothetical protein